MKKNGKFSLLSLVCIALLATAVISVSALADDNVVLFLNQQALTAISVGSTPPPSASRNLAILHTSIFDSVNAIQRMYQPYYVNLLASEPASLNAAAAAAGQMVLTNLYPTQDFSAVQTYLNAIPDGPKKTYGIALGQNVATQILNWRAIDGWDASYTYTPGSDPGDWRPTLPNEAPFLLPQWPDVTPFAMTSGSQFRQVAPPALDSAEYTADFNKTKSLGAVDSATRTAEQTQIAYFWADGAGTVTPPGHWNEIAATVAQGQVVQDARLFALLNIALADAAISSWDMKRVYGFWRPITAIREAGTDGNPLTEEDPSWTPLLTTPPFPSYVSGHSTFSGAAAEVLTDLFGIVSFETDSDTLPGVTRTFASFWDAAAEAGESRIYGGIHWEFDNVYGLLAGEQLGEYVFDNFLQPVPLPPGVLLLGSGLLGLLGWGWGRKLY